MRRRTLRSAAAAGLLLSVLATGGCAAIPALPSLIGGLGSAPDGRALHQTSVGLDQANYRIVQTDVRGESRGLILLMFITVDPISLTEAFDHLQANAPIEAGDARAFVNVVYERSARNFLLFALPKLSVRADVVEFVDAAAPPPAAEPDGDDTRASSPPGPDPPASR